MWVLVGACRFVFIYQTEIILCPTDRPQHQNRPRLPRYPLRPPPHATNGLLSHNAHSLNLSSSVSLPSLSLSTISPPPSHSFPLAAFCLSVILSPSESAMPCVFDRIRI